MHILSYIVLFVVAVLLQLKVVPLFSIKSITPDLILILVIAVAFRHGKIAGVVCGFLAGLFYDLFGTGLVGVSSLANSIAAFIAGAWSGEHLQRRFGIILGQLSVIVLAHDLVYFSILTIDTSIGFWNTLFVRIVPHTCYTLVFMAIISMTFPGFFLARRKN